MAPGIIMSSYGGEGRHIVFCVDPLIISFGRIVSCVLDIVLRGRRIFRKLAWMYHWDMPLS